MGLLRSLLPSQSGTTVSPAIPTGALAETFGRVGVQFADIGALTSGTLRLIAIEIPGGRTISSITFYSGNTALVTGSNQWFCLLDSARNVLGKTADDTSTAWAAKTPKTLTLTTPYVTPGTDRAFYYLGLVVVAAIVPTMSGQLDYTGNLAAIAPAISGNSTTGLTNPASLGATAAAISGSGGAKPWGYVS